MSGEWYAGLVVGLSLGVPLGLFLNAAIERAVDWRNALMRRRAG